MTPLREKVAAVMNAPVGTQDERGKGCDFVGGAGAPDGAEFEHAPVAVAALA